MQGFSVGFVCLFLINLRAKLLMGKEELEATKENYLHTPLCISQIKISKLLFCGDTSHTPLSHTLSISFSQGKEIPFGLWLRPIHSTSIQKQDLTSPQSKLIPDYAKMMKNEVIMSLSHLKKLLPAHTYSGYSYTGCSFTNRILFYEKTTLQRCGVMSFC